MKKIIFCFLIFIVSCTYGNKYDKKFVIDCDGNIYQLIHQARDTYFVRIQTNKDLDEIIKLNRYFKKIK
jgi:hypothetical protein